MARKHFGRYFDVLLELQNATYGLSALEALVDDLETRLSATRAGYLDELNFDLDARTLLLKSVTAQSIKAYPALASGLDLVSDNANWTLGNWVEVVPVNTITSDFVIIGVKIGRVVGGFDTLLEIGIATTTKIQIPYSTRNVTDVGIASCPIIMLPITFQVPANSQIQARITDDAGFAVTHPDCKIMYIELNL